MAWSAMTNRRAGWALVCGGQFKLIGVAIAVVEIGPMLISGRNMLGLP